MTAAPPPADSAAQIPPTEDERHTQTRALAGSTPDDSSTLLKMFRPIERLGPRWLSAVLIGIAVMFWTVVRFGGDLAIKMYPMVAELMRARGEQAQRADKDTATVLDGIAKIGAKVDTVADDLKTVKANQAAAERRLNAVAAEQRRQEARTPK